MSEDLKKRLAGRRVVASISGGKDSAALRKLRTKAIRWATADELMGEAEHKLEAAMKAVRVHMESDRHGQEGQQS